MRKITVSAFVVIALVCVPTAHAAKRGGGSTGTPSYVGQLLPMLAGDSEACAYGVADTGAVVGFSQGASGSRAFFWSKTPEPVNLTSDGATGYAWAIAGHTPGAEYIAGSEGGHAVIWRNPLVSGIVMRDSTSDWTEAEGVNENGVAVGHAGDSAAIWSPDDKGVYGRTLFAFDPGRPNTATDINDQGIVVGYTSLPTPTDHPQAFVRLADKTVHGLEPAGTDDYAVANAVSNVNGAGLFYVVGTTISAGGVERSVRWTVDATDASVSDTKVLENQMFGAGVNDAGDVAGSAGTSRQNASLWRNSAYIQLKPPSGASDAAAFAMARTATPSTYVAGCSQIKFHNHAVIWNVK